MFQVFLMVLLLSSGSFALPMERDGRIKSKNDGGKALVDKCIVNCDNVTPGMVIFIPFYCYILYPNQVTTSCPAKPTTTEKPTTTYKPVTTEITTTTEPTSTDEPSSTRPMRDRHGNGDYDNGDSAIEYLIAEEIKQGNSNHIEDLNTLVKYFLLETTEFIAIKLMDDNTLRVIEDADELKAELEHLQ